MLAILRVEVWRMDGKGFVFKFLHSGLMFFIVPKNLPTLLRDLLGHFAAGQEFDNSFLKVVLDFRGI